MTQPAIQKINNVYSMQMPGEDTWTVITIQQIQNEITRVIAKIAAFNDANPSKVRATTRLAWLQTLLTNLQAL